MDAARDLMVDNFLMTMMSQLSQDSNAQHIEVLYFLQVRRFRLPLLLSTQGSNSIAD